MADETVFNLIGDASSAISALNDLLLALDVVNQALQDLAVNTAAIDDVTTALASLATGASGVNDISQQTTVALDQVGQSATSAADQLLTVADASASVLGALDELTVAGGAAMAGLDGVDQSAMLASVGLSSTGRAMNASAASAGTLAGAAGTASSANAAMGKAAEEAGFNFQQEGMNAMMLMGMLLPLAGSFVKLGTDAQDAIARVVGLADPTLAEAKNAGILQQDIAALSQESVQFGVKLADAADGLYRIISAGFNTAGSLNILRYAMEAASATGAPMTSIGTALTAILRSYSMQASQAGTVTNQMVEAVVQGNQNFTEFANAIGAVASPASAAKIKLEEMLAAEATMTQIQPRVRQDTQNLAHLLQGLAANYDATVKEAKKLDPTFNANAYQSADLIGKLKMLSSVAKGNAADFKALLHDQTSVNVATMLLKNNGENYIQILERIRHSTGALDTAYQQARATISDSVNRIAAAFSVLSYQMTVIATPYVKAALDSITTAMGYLAQHSQILTPILAGLAVVMGGLLVTAIIALVGMFGPLIMASLSITGPIALAVAGFVAFHDKIMALIGPMSNLRPLFASLVDLLPKLASILIGVGAAIALVNFAPLIPPLLTLIGTIATGLLPLLGTLLTTFGAVAVAFVVANAPIIALAAALALLTYGFIQIVQHSRLMQSVIEAVRRTFADLGGIIMSAITPVIHQLQATLQTQLVPAWQHLMVALKPVVPLLEFLAGVLGGILVAAILIVIGAIIGLVRGISTFLTGLIQFIGGVIQVLSGIVGAVTGFLEIIVGVFTLNGDLIQKGWDAMCRGLLDIWVGAGNMLMGFFKATLGAIYQFIAGFVQSVINFFQNLSNVLVGHSIIPDMLNAMASVFRQVLSNILSGISSWIGNVVSTVQGMVGRVGSVIQGMAGAALSWGADIGQNIANGLSSMVGAVVGAATNVAGAIASILHHTKPEKGPLADDDQWMGHFGDNLATGLQSQVDKVQRAAKGVAISVAAAAPTKADIGALALPTSAASSPTIIVLQAILAELKTQTSKMGGGAGGVSLGHGVQGSSVGAVQQSFNHTTNVNASAQAMYSKLNAIAGVAAENGTRGSAVGVGI